MDDTVSGIIISLLIVIALELGAILEKLGKLENLGKKLDKLENLEKIVSELSRLYYK